MLPFRFLFDNCFLHVEPFHAVTASSKLLETLKKAVPLEMAAGMPGWVTKTLGFLGHSKGPQNSSTLAPPHELEQSPSYSKALPPLPPKAYLERQRVRASKRSRTQSPPFGKSVLEERKAKASLETNRRSDYENRSTQTDELYRPNETTTYPDPFSQNAASTDVTPVLLTVESAHAQDLNHSDHEQGKLVSERHQQSPAGSDHRDISLHASDSRATVEEMDIDEHVAQPQADNTQPQEQTPQDADALDGPPYTEGEVRIVLVSDGSKECLALILTSEMVAKIGQIATRSRRLEFVDRNLRKVKRQITSEENMLEYKTDALQDTNDQGKIAQINKEIEDTRRCLAAAAKCLDALEDEKLTLTTNLEFSREQSQEMFEDVLGKNDLLEVSDPEHAGEANPVGESVYSVEQDASQRQPYGTEDQDNSQAAISLDFDDVVRRTAKQDFEEKRNILITLDEAFEHRQDNLAEEKAEYLRRVREGTCDLSQTEFDLLALEDFRRMTTNLKDAQESFEESFKRAKQLGVLDEHDAYYQESVFSEWSGGYPMSMEHAMVGCAPTQRIGYWQVGMDESQDGRPWGGTELEPWSDPDLAPDTPDMEDCDLKSVAISDSWSCVDWSRRRRRIDRWREIAGRDR
ncbi:MAG: hypothetical protein Q9200_002805 [Gallowayella weberi]